VRGSSVSNGAALDGAVKINRSGSVEVSTDAMDKLDGQGGLHLHMSRTGSIDVHSGNVNVATPGGGEYGEHVRVGPAGLHIASKSRHQEQNVGGDGNMLLQNSSPQQQQPPQQSQQQQQAGGRKKRALRGPVSLRHFKSPSTSTAGTSSSTSSAISKTNFTGELLSSSSSSSIISSSGSGSGSGGFPSSFSGAPLGSAAPPATDADAAREAVMVREWLQEIGYAEQLTGRFERAGMLNVAAVSRLATATLESLGVAPLLIPGILSERDSFLMVHGYESGYTSLAHDEPEYSGHTSHTSHTPGSDMSTPASTTASTISQLSHDGGGGYDSSAVSEGGGESFTVPHQAMTSSSAPPGVSSTVVVQQVSSSSLSSSHTHTTAAAAAAATVDVNVGAMRDQQTLTAEMMNQMLGPPPEPLNMGIEGGGEGAGDGGLADEGGGGGLMMGMSGIPEDGYGMLGRHTSFSGTARAHHRSGNAGNASLSPAATSSPAQSGQGRQQQQEQSRQPQQPQQQQGTGVRFAEPEGATSSVSPGGATEEELRAFLLQVGLGHLCRPLAKLGINKLSQLAQTDADTMEGWSFLRARGGTISAPPGVVGVAAATEHTAAERKAAHGDKSRLTHAVSALRAQFVSDYLHRQQFGSQQIVDHAVSDFSKTAAQNNAAAATAVAVEAVEVVEAVEAGGAEMTVREL
jgi:hypothetical protein